MRGSCVNKAEQIRSAEKAKREASTGPNLVPQDAADAIVPSAQLSFPPQGTGKAVQREIPINKGVPNVG